MCPVEPADRPTERRRQSASSMHGMAEGVGEREVQQPLTKCFVTVTSAAPLGKWIFANKHIDTLAQYRFCMRGAADP